MTHVETVSTLEGFRLAPQQQRAWALQTEATAPAGRCGVAVQLAGTVTPAALREALTTLAERHEVLRTTFAALPGMTEAVQVIAGSAVPSLEVREGPPVTADELLAEALGRPLDLGRGPLFAALLAPLANGLQCLVIAAPALVVDSRSLLLLVGELARLVAREELAEPEWQYADLAEWQNELLEAAETAEGRDFWHRQLAATSRQGALPQELLAPEAAGFAPASRALRVPSEVAAAVAAAAAAAGERAGVLWLACWTSLLARLGDGGAQGHAVVLAGRRQAELAAAVGPLERSLPLRLPPLGPATNVVEVCRHLASELATLERWQEVFAWPLAHPLPCQPFAFDELVAGEAWPAGWHPLLVRSYAEPCKLRLSLFAPAAGETSELLAEITYDRNLYGEADADRLLTQLVASAASAAERPTAPLAALDLASPEEARSCRAELGRGADLAGTDRLLHEVFFARAAACPEAIAVELSDVQLSYAAVAAACSGLAGRLRELGVGPEVTVGVAAERSPELVIGVLAVLAAGGAYVPLDPGYPLARRLAMLRDAGAPLLLASRGEADRFAAAGVAVHELTALLAAAPRAGTPPPGGGSTAQLAYVIYTSGSTGTPKGVMVSHRAIANRLLWMLAALPIDAGDRVLQRTPLSFDAALWELFVPLFAGARLVLAPPAANQDLGQLIATLGERRVSVLQLVPTLLRLVLELPGLGEATALRLLFCGGEALPMELAERAAAVLPVAVHNLYGPTEAAIDVAHWPWQAGCRQRSVPIGRPLPNVELLVLDATGRPSAIGLPGELFAGGVNLARGYRGQPGRTAERFLPHPWGRTGGERLYRTGDLARWRPDGALVYLGRGDQQVKVHGVRVELGEVEQVLSSHPQLAAAVVLALPREAGDLRLVACVVPAAELAAPTAAELRAFASQRLPEPMVPGAFVTLASLPRLANGKLDRSRLAELAATSEPEERYVAPRNATEALLAEVWASVLRQPRVGVEDDFFALGGDSIRSLQLVARLAQRGLQLTPAQVLSHSTIAELAALATPVAMAAAAPAADLAAASATLRQLSQEEEATLARRYGEIEDAFVLTPIQAGMLFETLRMADAASYHSQLACTLAGELDPALLRTAWQSVIDRHPTLRTAFVWEGLATPHQVVLPHLEASWSEEDWRQLPAAEQEARFAALWAADRAAGFDLARPPLLRLRLVHLAPARHRLLVSHHHLLLDGFSFPVLLGDLARAFHDLQRGEQPTLPPAVPYRRYVEWLASLDRSGEEAAWRRYLGGLRAATRLGIERSEAEQASEGPGFEFHQERLSAATTAALGELAQRLRVTLNTLIQGAWALLLAARQGASEVVFGSTVSGRPPELAGVEEILGVFLNTLPLRVAVPPEERLDAWLQDLLARNLELRRHEHAPLADIQRWSGLPRGQRLFECIVVVENLPEATAAEASSLEIVELTALTPNNYPFTLKVSPGERLGLGSLYDRRRYRAADVAALLAQLRETLDALLANPAARLGDLQKALVRERSTALKAGKAQFGASFRQFQATAPQEGSRELVRKRPVAAGAFPLVIEPVVPDVDLVSWAASHREELDRDLDTHGALWLRGFKVAGGAELARFAEVVCDRLFEDYGDLPAPGDGTEKVYGATPYPADRTILFHNEASHTPRWPRKQMFLCVVKAEEGGETVLADGREVLRQLRPELRERFERLGLSYLRNFVEHLDVRWQDFFHTEDRAAVEARCRQAGVDCEWRPDGSLRLRNAAPAVVTHPRTGERLWFNQIQLHHVSCLDPQTRASLSEVFAPDELPRHVFFGDGSAISDDEVAEVGRALDASSIELLMAEGDLVLVDNIRVAHCRKPYRGERRVLVAMGEPCSREDAAAG